MSAEQWAVGGTRRSEVEVDSVGEILGVVVPSQKRKPYSFGGPFFMGDGASI